MAIQDTILSLFKANQMRTHRETIKSCYVKLQAKQVFQTCKKNKRTKNVNLMKFESEENNSSLIFSKMTSIVCDGRLSLEQFDKAAHDSMLEMLSIDPTYYYQISTPNELV